MRRGGKLKYLGTFVTAEEAALCVARVHEAGEEEEEEKGSGGGGRGGGGGGGGGGMGRSRGRRQ